MEFNSTIEFITASPYFTISGFLIGIFGIIAAIIIWQLSIKNKKPVYTIKSFTIIHDFKSAMPNLSIKYKNTEVKNLTISKLAFWNEGRETINKEDISKADPLKIKSINDVTILDKHIIFSTEKANMFKIIDIEDPKEFSFDFDFVDKNDAAIIQIIHTGISSDDIFLTGKIKGVKKIPKRNLQVVHRVRYLRLPGNIKLNLSDYVLGYCLLILTGAMFIFSIVSTINNFHNWPIFIVMLLIFTFFLKIGIPEIPEELGELVQNL
jgi:hypothetical protein